MLICLAMLPVGALAQDLPDERETQAIAKEAYVYGFPMVMNYKTMYQYAVDTQHPEYKGPFNKVACEARLFTPDDRAVVTPNADTPYCMFWMDLRAEPLVLSVPEMDAERYYSFQLIDLYTHNFAYVGSLTTGNGAGRYLMAGPGWDGKTPAGITDVIRSETDFIFNVTRTQLFGPDDLEKVKAIQAKYELQPLSAFLGKKAPAAPPLPEFPDWVEGSQFDERFFTYLDFMMDLLKKPGQGEDALWQQLARLGIGPGKTFRLDGLPDGHVEALKAGVKEGFADMQAFIAKHTSDPLASGKMFGTREFLTESARKNYRLDKPEMLRAAMAHIGLYGNSAAEAVYPTFLTDADGEPLDGSAHQYTITFPKGALPPVKAFWSLTMYDGKTQLFIENPLDRYLLNSDMTARFKQKEDGSLVLYVSKDSPGEDLEPNWLPAPDGPFYVVMRLYGPEEAALEGRWTPPEMKKAGGLAGDSAEPVSVNLTNFVRAESDHMIRANMKAFNVDFGQFIHLRKPTTPDNQPVIRMNQDTLYSATVLDLSKPVTITLPEVGGRYMSVHVVNQDHYMYVESKPGTYKLTEKLVGTRFALVTVRTFYNAGDPDDLAAAHAAQDKIEISGGGDGPFEAPNWDTDQLAVARKALSDLAVLGFDTTYAFGRKEEVRPIDHLVGAAAGWGGLPRTAAFYILSSVDKNDGKTAHALTVKDVPVDAFWSITVYNADGYLEANDLGRNSYNNFSAKTNKDGSHTIHFGGDPKSVNYLPITEGWNYAVRMYQPRKEILDGSWTFPSIEPVKQSGSKKSSKSKEVQG
jgi:hypothetical protein